MNGLKFPWSLCASTGQPLSVTRLLLWVRKTSAGGCQSRKFVLRRTMPPETPVVNLGRNG
jgi:hypothetical protein